MLGLRHFHGHAIDLFLGDISQFQCDGIVHFRPAADFAAELAEPFQLLFADGQRHIAVDWASADADEGSRVMAALYDFLTSQSAKMPHRVTFVVTDHAAYATLQEALFATFPSDTPTTSPTYSPT